MMQMIHSMVGYAAPARHTHARSACVAHIGDASRLRDLDPAEWDDLAAAALEPNPYLSPKNLLAAIEERDEGRGMRVMVLRRREDNRLVGLIPFRVAPVMGCLPTRYAELALNHFQVNGAPLIRRDHVAAALSAFFDQIGRAKGIPQHWVFPHVDFSSPLVRELEAFARSRDMTVLRARPYQRATLEHMAGGFAAHQQTTIGRKRVKDIQRNMRRLGEKGELRFERVAEPDAVNARLNDFLRIEKSGWKGEQGTALACNRADERYARRAFGLRPGEEGQVVIDSLLLDGIPIAVSINIRAGDTLAAPKCAFDETYRKYGPGLILEYLVVEAFHAQDEIREMDAATTVDDHVVAGIWNGTKPMGMLILGSCPWRTRLIATFEETNHSLRKAAKRLLARAWTKR